MKRIKKIREIRVTSVVSLDELSLEEAEAFAAIEAIDLSQAEVGFTINVIKNLVRSLKDEFKNDPEEWEDFKKDLMKFFE